MALDTGRKIMNLRRDLGVQQKSLAELTIVTPSALSRIESGVHQPRSHVALRLARHLGVTVEYLLDDSMPYPPPPREVLANLVDPHLREKPSEKCDVTVREKRLLLALRKLEYERRVLLEAVLAAPRKMVRRVAAQLGAGKKLPGVDDDELRGYSQNEK